MVRDQAVEALEEQEQERKPPAKAPLERLKAQPVVVVVVEGRRQGKRVGGVFLGARKSVGGGGVFVGGGVGGGVVWLWRWLVRGFFL